MGCCSLAGIEDGVGCTETTRVPHLGLGKKPGGSFDAFPFSKVPIWLRTFSQRKAGSSLRWLSATEVLCCFVTPAAQHAVQGKTNERENLPDPCSIFLRVITRSQAPLLPKASAASGVLDLSSSWHQAFPISFISRKSCSFSVPYLKLNTPNPSYLIEKKCQRYCPAPKT